MQQEKISKNTKKTHFEVIVQIRTGGLAPISKHCEDLKLRGEADHFLQQTLRCFEIGGSPNYVYLNILLKLSRISQKFAEKFGLIFVISSCDFQTSSTLLILFVLGS